MYQNFWKLLKSFAKPSVRCGHRPGCKYHVKTVNLTTYFANCVTLTSEMEVTFTITN